MSLFVVPAARVWAHAVPQTQAQALAYEKADRMPSTAFYDAPSPLPPGKPGELIRSQKVTDYDLPKAVRAVRILYHSTDAAGRDVAASGVVLVPSRATPKGGWPVIAWAHGTSGVARVCAPSMMKDVYYGTDLVPMVQAGFAVVATDYAGLGTAGPHQYMDLRAQANDVINSVAAARQGVRGLSPRWVVDGHSQGGGAAWFVAQRESVLNDPGYLGAVSVAPAILRHLPVEAAHSFYIVFVAYGVKARFPQLNVADLLTKSALAQYHALTTKGCWYYGYATQRSHLLSKSALKPRAADNPWVKRFFAENDPLQHRPSDPQLIIAGAADHTVPLQSVRLLVTKACRRGYDLQLRVLPGLDHDPTMNTSVAYQLRWIRARFDEQRAPDTCGAASR